MLKKNKEQKDFFLRILKNIVLLLITTVIIISTFFYFNFRTYSLNLLYDFNEQLLNQASEDIEKQSINTKVFLTSLFHHVSTQRLMINNYDDLYENTVDIRSIDKILALNPSIHSIYIYNPNKDTFYVFGEKNVIREGEIYDTEAKEIIMDNDYPLNSPVARRISESEFRSDKTVNVYSYVLKNMSNTNFDGAVIVNVYSSAFFNNEEYSNNNLYEIGDIYSIDNTGIINGSISDESFLQDISDKDYVKRIFEADEKSAYFISRVNGEKNLFFYVKNDILDWVFISQISHDYIDGFLDKVISVSLIFVIIIVISSVIASYYLSKKLYSPIHKLKNALNEKDFSDLDYKNIIEFKRIADTYQRTYDKLDDLENYKRISLQYEKTRLLNNILSKVLMSKEEISTLFNEYAINLDIKKPAIIFVLKVDDYNDNFKNRFSPREQKLYKFALKNITEEIVSKCFHQCEAFSSGDDYITSIISLGKNQYNYDDIVSTLEVCIQDIQKEFFKYIKVSVSGFISKITDNLFTLSEEYNDILELTKQRIVFGYGCILVSGNDEVLTMETYTKEDQANDENTQHNIEEMLEALKIGHSKKAVELYDHIIHEIKSCDYDTIIYKVLYLNSLITNMVYLMDRNSEVKVDIDFINVNQRLLKCETVEEINDIFYQIFKDITNNTGNQKCSKNQKYIDKINEYINSNYMIDTLSSAEIADMLGLSQSYMNRIYRNSCSISITNYIKKIRLEKAAELILGTDYTIDMILERVGWITKEYFYSSFKKQFGTTPGEYKLKGD